MSKIKQSRKSAQAEFRGNVDWFAVIRAAKDISAACCLWPNSPKDKAVLLRLLRNRLNLCWARVRSTFIKGQEHEFADVYWASVKSQCTVWSVRGLAWKLDGKGGVTLTVQVVHPVDEFKINLSSSSKKYACNKK